MEELLASIRMIISDESQPGAAQVESPASRRMTPPKPPQSDDVLELTDELMFPEDGSPEKEPAASENVMSRPSLSVSPVDRSGYSGPSFFPEAQRRPMRDDGRRLQDTQKSPRPEQSSAGPRPVWSRRELPNAPHPARPDGERATPRPNQRFPAEDIQMPVPKQGPVSLVEAALSGARALQDARPDGETFEDAQSHLEQNEEAAVAALAENLARTAVGSLETGELESAGNLNFQRLDDEQKAHVTETFATVIEAKRQAQAGSPLPSLLDEVLRQDFIRDAQPEPETPDDTDDQSYVQDEADEAQDSAVEPEAMEPADLPTEDISGEAQHLEATSETVPRAPAVANNAPAVQAQFIGPVAAASDSQTARTLEDAVREMLRPLLVQWLNEHMPRILENAIREEIAARGIFPKQNG
jgi:cell pole-organizing protein PopZ